MLEELSLLASHFDIQESVWFLGLEIFQVCEFRSKKSRNSVHWLVGCLVGFKMHCLLFS